jgi:hypothetical protein
LQWFGTGTQICDLAAIPPSRSSAKVCTVCTGEFLARGNSDLTPFSALCIHSERRDFICAGRAPPLAIHHV